MRRQLFSLLALTCLAAAAGAEERHESFDRDPGWEGRGRSWPGSLN